MAQATELGMVLIKLLVLGAELGSCHSIGDRNFKLAPTFMENLCTTCVDFRRGLLNWKFLGNLWRSNSV